MRRSFFIPTKEIHGFMQECTFPSPLPCVPEIARGRTNESTKDKEMLNLVSKRDSFAVPLFTKKRYT